MKLLPFFLLVSILCQSQSHMSIRGRVLDDKTKDPLPFATISIIGNPEQTVSASDGSFQLIVPPGYLGDTLMVTYLGYRPLLKKIDALPMTAEVWLTESYTLLEEVVISHAKLNMRKVEKNLRVIHGNLYAMETEVTNEQYNLFLAWLSEHGQHSLRRECDYDLSAYDKGKQAFFQRYVTQYRVNGRVRDSVNVLHIGPHAWGDYPAVNVSHEGARQYCKWLTEQYNAWKGRKKFKKVEFRLPSLQEWQIAALGSESFQTWELEENHVEVWISGDSLRIAPKKGTRKTIPVGKDVLYPWYSSYYYRRSPQNHKGCFLGNFRVDSVEHPCPAVQYAYDGWSMMARTASYFPNNIGLYDVVGNVAEMIAEKGKACGGSWDESPHQSTIHSVRAYTHPGATIGFRVFMEVLE